MRITLRSIALATAAITLLVFGASYAAPPANDADVKAALEGAHAKFKNVKEGKNADYIPALAKVDSKIFGLAVVTTDGRVFTTGDITSEVSIQSISKVFTLALVLEQQGAEAVQKNIGVDATGQAFNSIVAVEQYKGSEMNPLVNRAQSPRPAWCAAPTAT